MPSKLFYIVDVIFGGTITNTQEDNLKKIKQKFSKNNRLLPRKGCFGMFQEKNNHQEKMKKRKKMSKSNKLSPGRGCLGGFEEEITKKK